MTGGRIGGAPEMDHPAHVAGAHDDGDGDASRGIVPGAVWPKAKLGHRCGPSSQLK
jgi:hypothetical protein